jgi:hypothetical protein
MQSKAKNTCQGRPPDQEIFIISLARGWDSGLSSSKWWPFSKYVEIKMPLTAGAGLLSKSSCLAPTLGVTINIIVRDLILISLCCAT